MRSQVRGYLSDLGRQLHLAVFTLSAISLAVLLGPALMDKRPIRSEKYILAVEDAA